VSGFRPRKQRGNRWVIILVRWQGTDGRDCTMLWWRRTYFEGGCSEGTALVRELIWPCTVMCPLEQAAFVAELYQHQRWSYGKSRRIY
jgi:hypothetical protein